MCNELCVYFVKELTGSGCCNYLTFIFSLKPLDVEFMKAIHNKVNIVPVIAKADALTLKERERLKKRVSVLYSYRSIEAFC